MSGVKLPPPPRRYDPAYEARRNRVLDDLSRNALTSGGDIVLRPGVGIVLYDSGGATWRVTVSTAGALVVDAYTP